jgi:multiple sugar transport system substrate-binding protein
VLVIFIVAAVFGVVVFAGLIKIGDKDNTAGSQGTVVLWGTEKSGDIARALESFNKANPAFIVKYVQKDPETFDRDLLEALASGEGPDIFFITNDLAYKYSNKIFTIPYASYPLASFKGTFASAGEVFLTSEGVLAFPITIDPLILYYNRSMLDSNGIIYPPADWSQLGEMVPTLTRKDSLNKIAKSAVALGQFVNVDNAKNILATLFMQAGNSIISEKNGIFSSALDDYNQSSDLSSILKFYTSFSDPLNSLYSWNRSLQNSQAAFSAEDLAFYFGYAGEFQSLVKKNPNQNFLVAPMPQIKNANFKLTEAQVKGIAISSFSKNFGAAFTAASLLATGDFVVKYVEATGAVPARRDLLAKKQTDAFSPIFYASALYARSWLDPSADDSDDIFRNMIEKVLSNSLSPREAVEDASGKLDLLLAR